MLDDLLEAAPVEVDEASPGGRQAAAGTVDHLHMARVTTRRPTTCSREEAADALMLRLESWRTSLRPFLDDEAGGQYTPNRSWTGLKQAHQAGDLIGTVTAWFASPQTYAHSPSAMAMAEIVKSGQRTWEHILIEPNRPWSMHVGDAVRANVLALLAECYGRASDGMALRAKIQADMQR